MITADQLRMVDPNWKTLEGDCVFHVLFQSTISNKNLIELMKYYIQENDLNPDLLDSNGNTALHIACRVNKPALVPFLLNEARCDPNVKNQNKCVPLDIAINPEIIYQLCRHDQIAVFSWTVKGWMNNRSIDDYTYYSHW